MVITIWYALGDAITATLGAKAWREVRHQDLSKENATGKKRSNNESTRSDCRTFLIEGHGSIRHFLHSH
jgi:hypothetical protein